MNINERIAQLRKYLNLSQEGFGEKLGVKKSAISKLENGSNNPTDAMIKHICVVYHVNYLWLTEGQGEMLEEEDAEAMIERVMAGHSEFAISIMKAFTKLPDEEWYKLRDLIDKIKKEGLS